MRVTVHLFARLRDLAGAGEFDVDVPEGASVVDVWRQVTSRHAELEPFAASVSCAVNEEFARMGTPVRNRDEVAFLPPVSGGARV
jgi:molybdopterin converting factor subunit 1